MSKVILHAGDIIEYKAYGEIHCGKVDSIDYDKNSISINEYWNRFKLNNFLKVNLKRIIKEAKKEA